MSGSYVPNSATDGQTLTREQVQDNFNKEFKDLLWNKDPKYAMDLYRRAKEAQLDLSYADGLIRVVENHVSNVNAAKELGFTVEQLKPLAKARNTSVTALIAELQAAKKTVTQEYLNKQKAQEQASLSFDLSFKRTRALLKNVINSEARGYQSTSILDGLKGFFTADQGTKVGNARTTISSFHSSLLADLGIQVDSTTIEQTGKNMGQIGNMVAGPDVESGIRATENFEQGHYWTAAGFTTLAVGGIVLSKVKLGGRIMQEGVEHMAPRTLAVADLGVKGSIKRLEGTFSIVDNVGVAKIDFIQGAIKNPFDIIKGLSRTAYKNGANSLRIEATLANEKLYNILTKRYGMISEGGRDFINVMFR
ncbi:MAG: hypothetical protein KDK39_07865 [Leptospiraceae bacterium]|nr:hypothetical protein [Leptospiraceae bacterium]